MIKVIPSEARSSFDRGWLRGSHSFSFGEYQDPYNTAFGPMRVANDDVIAPGRGFGAHPHSDMEIVSIVLNGKLRHEDSLGNVAVTGFGSIQRMSAGSGVIHTEHNASDTEEVRLLQLWFMPHTKGLQPSYETTSYDITALEGALVPVVSSDGGPRVATVHQDMTIYLGRLSKGKTLDFEQNEGRRMYIFSIEGKLGLQNEHVLHTGDTARVEQTSSMKLEGHEDTFYMLIDLP
ncbi:redox-sensitive bicupin YhaK (pirin superfamily) [Paenibacillus intestini]|uniref:Pirin family protein n=1 Tax=Paenibacillus cucumis (ex Kampfer et al. 2016) TaxID=1776858 RepID=A0ABS7KM23_9BACL|nr:pirin family protein [Paenibacillus cucumis (ex Kampfer et al. 2016)]MBY0205170.1 pirin family protein [Paenibacillus cucumis (ex Kampfer et al. 2016)]MDP9700013.1 redox-sensitive bicupin YhaK (pirin superfamily) [Paenibacillus intestini]